MGYTDRHDETVMANDLMADATETSLGRTAAGRVGPGEPVHLTLRDARMAAGYSLQDVASLLRIRSGYLQAIENGRYDDLPGKVYAIGFVRSYADFLHLDSDLLVQRFKHQASELDASPTLIFPAPVPEGRVPGGAIMLIAVLLAGLAYGGWYYISATDRQFAELVPTMPDRLAELIEDETAADGVSGRSTNEYRPVSARATEVDDVEAEVEALTVAAAGTAEAPAPSRIGEAASRDSDAAPASADPEASATTQSRSAPAQDETVTMAALETGRRTETPVDSGAGTADRAPAEAGPGGQVASVEASPSTSGSQAGTTTESAPPPPPTDVDPSQHFGLSHQDARIVIRATGMSYVEVVDSDRRRVWWRTLRPGESYGVPQMDGLRMVTGNAGALQIEVDGSVVPSLGASGEVVRNVPLDANLLSTGTAVN